MDERKAKQKRTRTDEVLRRLEQEILAGEYRPGQHLDEVSQSVRLGCSRTPLREAFNQLVAQGLLERRPHCGVFVAQDTHERVQQLIEALVEADGLCASLAASRISGRVRAGLNRKSERDPEGLRRTVRQACGNPFMAEFAEGLERRLAPYRRLEGALAEERDRSAALALAEAITRADAEAARRVVRDRLRSLADTVVGALGGRVAAAA